MESLEPSFHDDNPQQDGVDAAGLGFLAVGCSLTIRSYTGGRYL
jgi:hypothetical protein